MWLVFCISACDFIDSSTAGVTITVQVTEVSALDLALSPNSALYKADTRIQGILNGNDPNTGVVLSLIRTAQTPSQVDLAATFELVTESITTDQFGFNTRTFIKLKQAIDRDVSDILIDL